MISPCRALGVLVLEASSLSVITAYVVPVTLFLSSFDIPLGILMKILTVFFFVLLGVSAMTWHPFIEACIHSMYKSYVLQSP